mmetsp:Transcript_62506/g.157934  ORF Transcript_62506/g.157934 Transcript_62506/m.157934 type:complete len:208 (+) Transcript_62506:375-998(+)
MSQPSRRMRSHGEHEVGHCSTSHAASSTCRCQSRQRRSSSTSSCTAGKTATTACTPNRGRGSSCCCRGCRRGCGRCSCGATVAGSQGLQMVPPQLLVERIASLRSLSPRCCCCRRCRRFLPRVEEDHCTLRVRPWTGLFSFLAFVNINLQWVPAVSSLANHQSNNFSGIQSFLRCSPRQFLSPSPESASRLARLRRFSLPSFIFHRF